MCNMPSFCNPRRPLTYSAEYGRLLGAWWLAYPLAYASTIPSHYLLRRLLLLLLAFALAHHLQRQVGHGG
jgi:hypothetical protein